MAQNIYDDEEFFVAYSGLRRSVEGLDGAPEWPTLRSMLPTMSGRRVVDLGCGFGWFSRWAAAAGAASVLGIDLSEKMLARAVADTSDDRITYQRQNLDVVELPAAAFDVAYSSLALHYLARPRSDPRKRPSSARARRRVRVLDRASHLLRADPPGVRRPIRPAT